jgi:uncharacterized protein YjbI with pentapeptide repeats
MPQITREEILGRAFTAEGLRGANLVRADLSGLEMVRVNFAEANLRMADLSGADLTEAQLSGCFLSGASMSQSLLIGANLVEASIIGAILEGADLSRADLSGADLTGASLKNAQLAGAYLVGTFLNETDLSGANMTGAYVRMSQMSGSNLSGASLDGADLSRANLSGVRLDNCSLLNANLSGADLSASVLRNCDLRGADLTFADLTGCNLTGARLHGVKGDGAKLVDTWAEWVDLGQGKVEERGSLEEAFVGMVGKPMAQLLVAGHVGDDVWVAILEHLCEFRLDHSEHSDVALRAIHKGTRSSALFLEAEREMSLAAFFADLTDLLGAGSTELFGKLEPVLAEHIGYYSTAATDPPETPEGELDGLPDVISLDLEVALLQRTGSVAQVAGSVSRSRIEAVEGTAFWNAEKALVILTGNRQVWLEAATSQSLTLRPPHGAAQGVDIVCGKFVTDEGRRKKR